ncbi:MAG TPA: hypothetical protein IAA77_05220 [Candidatus Avibacteroides excrementipullorum]|jgi:hypothetical protein|nr:hypothetical protein [Candidatus Avibacteroides excrementipullorum]
MNFKIYYARKIGFQLFLYKIISPLRSRSSPPAVQIHAEKDVRHPGRRWRTSRPDTEPIPTEDGAHPRQGVKAGIGKSGGKPVAQHIFHPKVFFYQTFN